MWGYGDDDATAAADTAAATVILTMGFNHGFTLSIKIMKIVDQKSNMTKKMDSTSQKKKNRFWEHQ